MAQVDTGIYQNLLRPPKSVQEYDAEAQQAEGNKLSLLLQRGQYDAQQRGVAQEQKLGEAYQNALKPDGTIDRTKLYTSAASSGLGAKIPALQKQFLDTDKAQAEIDKERAQTGKFKADAGKTDWDTAVAKQAHIAQLASSATDQASWTQARKIAQMLGADVSQVPEQFDPATAKHFGDMAMTQAQRLDQAHKEAVLAETTRNNKVQNGIAAGQLRVSQGQLGVAQQRLAQERDAPKGQYDAERGVLVDPRTGVAKPVTMDGKPMGAKEKTGAATEGERKAATLLTRLRGSKAQLDAVLEKDKDAAKPSAWSEAARGIPFIGGDTAANLVTSEKRQQVEAAQLDMLDAALTLGTGAAYTKEQLRGYARSYFPQIGDDAATIEDKKVRLNNVIKAAEIAAGRADPGAGQSPGGQLSASEQSELQQLRARFGKK